VVGSPRLSNLEHCAGDLASRWCHCEFALMILVLKIGDYLNKKRSRELVRGSHCLICHSSHSSLPRQPWLIDIKFCQTQRSPAFEREDVLLSCPVVFMLLLHLIWPSTVKIEIGRWDHISECFSHGHHVFDIVRAEWYVGIVYHL
jgi:hypothetical protein